MTPIKATVLANGWQAQVKNPYSVSEHISGPKLLMQPEYEAFQRSNPPLNLTSYCEPGSEVYLEEVEQYSPFSDFSDSVFNNRFDADPEDEFETIYYRKLYQPIPAPKLEQPTLTVQEAAEKWHKNQTGFILEKKIGFIAGWNECANHILTSGEYVSVREVEDAIGKYYNSLHSWEDANPKDMINLIKNLKHSK